MAYIHVYKDNPTAGEIDGTTVSERTLQNPITTSLLNSAQNEESTAIKLALRCDDGYNTVGDTTITLVGTSANKWALSADGVTWGAYGASLIISSIIGVVNTIFYCKAKAVNNEPPVNDTSVFFQLLGNLVAV